MKTQNPRNHNIHAKIASEGYCCIWGYLKLCEVRGQKPADMMPFLGLSRLTFYHHKRKLDNGVYSCERKPDCLADTIEELSGNPPSGGGSGEADNPDLGSPKGKASKGA